MRCSALAGESDHGPLTSDSGPTIAEEFMGRTSSISPSVVDGIKSWTMKATAAQKKDGCKGSGQHGRRNQPRSVGHKAK